jgi:hypothetical protein
MSLTNEELAEKVVRWAWEKYGLPSRDVVESQVLLRSCYSYIVALAAIQEAGIRLAESQAEFAILSRACDNWRMWGNVPEDDHAHPDWRVAAKAILERNELRAERSTAIQEAKVQQREQLAKMVEQIIECRGERDKVLIIAENMQRALSPAPGGEVEK